MKYDILLFDADRTLFDFDSSEKLAFYETAPLHGIVPSPETYALYKKINNRNWEALEKGLATKERILIRRFEELFSELGIEGDPVAMDLDYLHALAEKSILFFDTVPLINRLEAAGKRLFLVTNGVTIVQEGRISRSPLAGRFEEVFISEQLGVAKPHKEFFDIVRSRIANFDVEKAVVIGDSPSSDIRGANNAGLHCVWLNMDGRTLPTDLHADYTVTSLNELGDLLINN